MPTIGRHWADRDQYPAVDDEPDESNAHWVFGFLVVLGAAVLTVHGLFGVAVSATVPKEIAWIYPAITDGLALVAYVSTQYLEGGARKYAWTVVVIAAGLSGLAQAVYLVGGSATAAADGLRFGVGAWPAICAAIAAHLVFLLREARRAARAAAAERQRQHAAEMAAQRKADEDRRAAQHVRELEALARVEQAKHQPAKRTPAKRATTRKPTGKPAAPAPEIGTGSRRAEMQAYLDEHSDEAVAGDISGGQLDKLFGTNNYGRGVLKAWRDKYDKTQATAVGE